MLSIIPKQTPNHVQRNISILKQAVFDKCSFQMTNPILEEESSEYHACTFEINKLKIVYRNAKITPTKIGQFVTLWKRINGGSIQPFHFKDSLDLVVINTQTDRNLGQFVFPKSVLLDKGILSTENKEGKRGFRVYPPWDKTSSPQAIKTQAWQLEYFLSNNDPLDIECTKRLYLQG